MRITTLLALLAILCLTNTLSAQKNPKLINSGEIINKGVQLHDDEKYERAIEEYRKVGRNDTNYTRARYEIAYSYYKHEQYDSAINICRELVARDDYHGIEGYTLLGNALDDAKRNEEAVAWYRIALQKFPKVYLLHYNQGVAYYRSRDFDAAYNSFKNSLALNPRHPASHYFIGILQAENKRWAPAMLAMHTAILMQPNENLQRTCLTMLINIAKGDYVVDTPEVKFSEKEHPAFAKIDKLIESKVAFRNEYKIAVKLDDKLMKQTQFLLESLKQNKPDAKDFFAQQYLDFYLQLLESEHLATFLYYPFRLVDNDLVNKWKSKSKKDIDKFEVWFAEYFAQKAMEYSDTVNGETQKFKRFFYRNGIIQAIGNDYDSKTQIRKGYWRLFYNNSYIELEGKYDNSGNMQGEWRKYYEDGKLRYIAVYKDGKINGLFKEYYQNGNLRKEAVFKDGFYNGVVKEYYKSGGLETEADYKEGRVDGKMKTYFANSHMNMDIDAKNDKIDGKIKQYTIRGHLKSIVEAKNGEREGKYEEFFPDGKLMETGLVKTGKMDGKWLTYNNAGVVIVEGDYVLGDLSGTRKKYHDNGKLANEEVYVKGKIQSQVDYDEDGVKFFEGAYNKDGTLVSYKYLDKSGKVLQQGSDSKGDMEFIAYRPDGTLSFKGFFKKGERDGEWTYYYWCGALREKEKYEKGLLNGSFTEYYKNGRVKREGTYQEGKLTGYCRKFYESGKIEEEYNLVDGSREGDYYSYHTDGSLFWWLYYREGEERGWQTSYHPGGKINFEYLMDEGYLTKYLVYDTNGKVAHAYANPTGTGKYDVKYFNGKQERLGEYVNGNLTGIFKFHYSTGQLKNEGRYVNDYRTGPLKEYHFNGKIAKEGFYKTGWADSTWTFYDEKGVKDVVGQYKEDSRNGYWTWYYPNGKVEFFAKYIDGDKDSIVTSLSPDGLLRIKYRYDEGLLMGYTYIGKDGKEVPEITIKNETADVVAYYPNGNKSFEGKYVNGQKEGTFKYYYSDGKIQWEENFEKGLQTGKLVHYLADGKKEREETYIADELHGPAKYYDKSGVLYAERNFYYGYLHGPYKTYEAGKLKSETNFYYGIELPAN